MQNVRDEANKIRDSFLAFYVTANSASPFDIVKAKDVETYPLNDQSFELHKNFRLATGSFVESSR